jgi:cytoskeletal protein CcmA (bactofilin family)
MIRAYLSSATRSTKPAASGFLPIKRAARPPKVGAVNPNVLYSDVQIFGKVHGAKDLQFDGTLEGEISADEGLTLGKSAIIRGNVRAGSLKLFGRIEGDVQVREICIILAGASALFQ